MKTAGVWHSIRRALVAIGLSAAWAGTLARADDHPAGVPGLSSRPGAPYTLYLDFAGFNFTGDWGGISRPGTTPAYNLANDDPATFSTTELANLRSVWARVAEKYTAFNVNVTTIDPAVPAGRADSDAARQQFYDATPHLLHTVIGGTGTWNGGGGVSFVNKAQFSFGTAFNDGAGYGWHTNFVFSALAPTNLGFIGEATCHELGHGLGLNHQGDHFTAENGTTYNNEYSRNGGFTGPGTFSPVMGNSYSVQRGLWRVGRPTTSSTQNDVQVLAANGGIGPFIDDGIGHSPAAASPLPVSDGTVLPGLAQGVIVPTSKASPRPLGAANYTSDYFVFGTDGGPVSLTLHNGAERLAAGTADPGATLSGVLSILDTAGNPIAVGTLADDTLSSTFIGTLDAGTYLARITSNGGFLSSFDTSASYYSMGSYFLTGSGFVSVPEPALPMTIAILLLMAGSRRGKKRGGNEQCPLPPRH